MFKNQKKYYEERKYFNIINELRFNNQLRNSIPNTLRSTSLKNKF